MLKPALIAATLIVAHGLAAPTWAASHDRDVFIREQDVDGDGKVSKDDFAAGREKEYARMDANHDKGLSHDEYVGDFKDRLEKRLTALPAERAAPERDRQMRQAEVRFGVLDSDKSGKITPAEFAASGWSMFAHHDTNKDGFITTADPTAKDAD